LNQAGTANDEGFDLNASINQRDTDFKVGQAPQAKSAFAVLDKIDSENPG